MRDVCWQRALHLALALAALAAPCCPAARNLAFAPRSHSVQTGESQGSAAEHAPHGLPPVTQPRLGQTRPTISRELLRSVDGFVKEFGAEKKGESRSPRIAVVNEVSWHLEIVAGVMAITAPLRTTTSFFLNETVLPGKPMTMGFVQWVNEMRCTWWWSWVCWHACGYWLCCTCLDPSLPITCTCWREGDKRNTQSIHMRCARPAFTQVCVKLHHHHHPRPAPTHHQPEQPHPPTLLEPPILIPPNALVGN